MADAASAQAVRDVLASFGELRVQPPTDWAGEGDLHPSVAAFYAKVGPFRSEDDEEPEGISIPTVGNPFDLPLLSGLWSLQEGYRWHGRTGEPIAGWRPDWLVVADHGGDPFILDKGSGEILHDRHGGGGWAPVALFPDIFVMAHVLGTIGALIREAGEDLYDEDFNVRPDWLGEMRVRLLPILGQDQADVVIGRLMG